MAKQTINLGTSANKGDGDPLRTAFDKVNDNFDELYARDLNTDAQTLSLDGDVLSISDGNSVTITHPTVPTATSDLTNDSGFITLVDIPTDLTGSVFADDSTLLVDGVAGKIVGSVETDIITGTGDTGSEGESLELRGGTNTTSDNGGWLIASGGNGTETSPGVYSGNGAPAFFTSGDGLQGGDVTVFAGSSTSTEIGTTGGDVNIRGGNATGSGSTGGDVVISAGVGDSINGDIKIGTSNTLSIQIGESAGVSSIGIGKIGNTTTNIYGDAVFREGDIEFSSSAITFGTAVDGDTPSIDFTGATVTGLTAAPNNITNESDTGSTVLAEGDTMTRDFLSVRVVDDAGDVDVQIKYTPTELTTRVSAGSTHFITGESAHGKNVYSGSSDLTVGNTTWTSVLASSMTAEGDTVTTIITDHSNYKIYRITATLRNLPVVSPAALGSVSATIEELK